MVKHVTWERSSSGSERNEQEWTETAVVWLKNMVVLLTHSGINWYYAKSLRRCDSFHAPFWSKIDNTQEVVSVLTLNTS